MCKLRWSIKATRKIYSSFNFEIYVEVSRIKRELSALCKWANASDIVLKLVLITRVLIDF